MNYLRRQEKTENIPMAKVYLRDWSNPMEDQEDYEFEHWFCFSTEMVASILDMISKDFNTSLAEPGYTMPLQTV